MPPTQYQVWQWKGMLFGPLQVQILLNTFEGKRCVILCCTASYHSISFCRQVGRVSNPFESTLASIIIFGSQLLALTEGGEHMLIWDTSGGGKRDLPVCTNSIA